MFEGLQTIADPTPSTSSAPQAPPAPQAPKKKRTPPIFVKIARIEGPLLGKLKAAAPTCYFEYVATGLRVQTKNQVEHAAATETLKREGIEFFTYNPNPGSTIKFVLRGLPPNASCEEIAHEIKNAGIALTHAKQMTKNSIHPETREKFVSPLPLWVLTIAREDENIKKLKQLTGILNFRIRVEDLRVTKKDIQCFRCQRYGHKADFCQLKRKCVKCGEDHLARECPKGPTTKATCANCQGEHPANFKKCPAAIKYKERKSAPKEQEKVNLNINSNTEFPSLPSRPQRPQTNSTTTPTAKLRCLRAKRNYSTPDLRKIKNIYNKI